MRRSATLATAVAAAGIGWAACGDAGPAGPDAGALAFEVGSAATTVRPATGATLRLRNDGGRRVGPIRIAVEAVRDEAGLSQTGVSVIPAPGEVPTLAPGASATIRLTLHGADRLGLGRYRSRITARVDGRSVAETVVEVEGQEAPSAPVAQLTLEVPESMRRGDVVRLGAAALDSAGAPVARPGVRWSVDPGDAGWIDADGRFVAYRTGPIRISARAGDATASETVAVSPRERRMEFRLAAEGVETRRFTSDLWVHGGFAWTGSWGVRQVDGEATPGNRLTTWRLDPSGPVVTDSVVVDARTTNDVKVSADGRLGVVTHEGSNDARNGVTLLDLSDPAHPVPVGRFTRGLESGVHNAWIDGPWLYLVVDGVGSGLRVLDVSDPAAPRVVASWYAGSSFLHDVLVRDGLAFLAHWDAGLVILDVGDGRAGGSPASPVEVGRLTELGGQTHNVWYWPARALAFVGEEDFATPGRMHVVDVSEPSAPREVATFAVPGTTPHNFWLDEEAEILYLAWYDAGVRALDVSGELLGELDRQGRELGAWTRPGATPRCWSGMGTCTWAPQLHDGRLYLADVNRGLVVLEPVVGEAGAR